MFKYGELKPRTRRPEKPNTDAISFFLVADGTDTTLVDALRAEAAKGGAEVKVVARKVGGARAADGTIIHANFQLAGGPSVLFDAAYVALSADGAAMMSKEAAAVCWVHDAFSHLMVIGATTDARPLLTAAGVVADEGVLIEIRPADYLSKVAHGRIYDRESESADSVLATGRSKQNGILLHEKSHPLTKASCVIKADFAISDMP